MKAAGIVTFGTDLVNPDFAAVARSMGIFGRRVEQPGDLDAALATIDSLAAQPRVRAVGETGLDFFRTNYVRGDLMSLLTQYILFAGLVYFTISMLATYAVKRLQRRLSV